MAKKLARNRRKVMSDDMVAALDAEIRPKRVTSTGRVGGGGFTKHGRQRKLLFGMRVTREQLDTVHATAATREEYAEPGVKWSASEYVRALVTLDVAGAVDWSKLERGRA